MHRISWWTAFGLAIIVTCLTGLIVGLTDFSRSAIEEGVPYSLGYTYLVDLEYGDGEGISQRARVFDFADRNLPEKSIVVPLEDANGILLVKRNSELPVNSVQKVRIKIADRNIEGVVYPAYEFVRWEFNPGTTEAQSVVPKMKPRS